MESLESLSKLVGGFVSELPNLCRLCRLVANVSARSFTVWDYLIRFGGGVEPNGQENQVESGQLGRVHSPSQRLNLHSVL
ncbi:hypothetical protein Hanom_Chr12g01070231 [Helianthus anomalus]